MYCIHGTLYGNKTKQTACEYSILGHCVIYVIGRMGCFMSSEIELLTLFIIIKNCIHKMIYTQNNISLCTYM